MMTLDVRASTAVSVRDVIQAGPFVCVHLVDINTTLLPLAIPGDYITKTYTELCRFIPLM